jgi:polysaccharide export outer membrane protein
MSMDFYLMVPVRASSSQLTKVSTAASLATIAIVAVLASCTPVAVPPNMQNTQSPEVSKPAVAEINNALATLAKYTASSTADYEIGPEDLLQITLFNVSGEDAKVTPRIQTVRVSQQGMISLPLLGELRVIGLTVSGLEWELRKQYDRYIYAPQVGVAVMEHRQRVSVIGAVQRPGVVDLTGPKTLIDILSIAGGITERAGTQVHIYRQGANRRESHVVDLLALASNASFITASNAALITAPVQSGDVINVPPAGMFFVDGAVGRPGSYPLGRQYSLTQALAVAGGVNRDLNSSDITIFRRKTPSEVEPITVNLNSILENRARDPKIEEDDVILVPINSVKYVYQRVFGQLLGWSTSITGMAAVTGS